MILQKIGKIACLGCKLNRWRLILPVLYLMSGSSSRFGIWLIGLFEFETALYLLYLSTLLIRFPVGFWIADLMVLPVLTFLFSFKHSKHKLRRDLCSSTFLHIVSRTHCSWSHHPRWYLSTCRSSKYPRMIASLSNTQSLVQTRWNSVSNRS